MLRMYRRRPFGVVRVNAPDEHERKQVLSFLDRQKAITRNLLFGFNDPADGIAAFGTGRC